jgi:hypothetical protein
VSEDIVFIFILTSTYHFQVDPSTGEAEDEGYEDEYQLEDLEVSSSFRLSLPSVHNAVALIYILCGPY